MTTLAWVAVELDSGRVLADLPLLDGDSGPVTIVQTMGRYEQAIVTLPVNLQNAVPDWEYATMPAASALVLLQDDVPIWGAYIARRKRGAGDVIWLTLMTMEGYFDRRYLGDVSFTQVGQNSIVQSLVNSYAAAGSNGGIPIRVQVVNGGVGTLRDRTYFDKDDKTLYSALQDLAGVINGPEWTIGWEHQSNPERFTPVLYVGDRLGTASTAGLSPAAMFDMPGAINNFSYEEDYGVGRGATDVMAYSSGQGDVRPQSPRQVAADLTRPTFEYRWTPSTSITDVSTLTGYAQGKLLQLSGGTTTVALSAILKHAPKLGIDWFMGDDIGFQIGGLDGTGRDTVPAFPGGLTGVARAIGYQLTLDNTPTITPVLAGSDL